MSVGRQSNRYTTGKWRSYMIFVLSGNNEIKTRCGFSLS